MVGDRDFVVKSYLKRYDPRYQFLRDLHSAPADRTPVLGDTHGSLDGASPSAASFAGALDRRGMAGPLEGHWWWALRATETTASTFAKNVLELLEDEVTRTDTNGGSCGHSACNTTLAHECISRNTGSKNDLTAHFLSSSDFLFTGG